MTPMHDQGPQTADQKWRKFQIICSDVNIFLTVYHWVAERGFGVILQLKKLAGRVSQLQEDNRNLEKQQAAWLDDRR